MLDGAAAGGEHRPRHGPGFAQQLPLRPAKTVPAGTGDDLGHTAAQSFTEHGIGVDKGVPETGGEQPTDRGLAGGTESGEDDDWGIFLHDSAHHKYGSTGLQAQSRAGHFFLCFLTG
jgi:hypothetical protein